VVQRCHTSLAACAATTNSTSPSSAIPIWLAPRFTTDTIVQDARTLRDLVDVVGSGRIMVGSDRPFPIRDPAPVKIVEATALSGAERTAIHHVTTPRRLGL
jgi:aminocarboxymuconate-semialdehyde decarboxylase